MKTTPLLAIALVFAIGCSPKASNNAPGPTAANAVGVAYCQMMQRCGSLELLFTSQTDCASVMTGYYGTPYTLPGVTQDEVNAYVHALATQDCATIDAYQATGSLANGAGCLEGLQCQSGVCSAGLQQCDGGSCTVSTPGPCGVCQGAPAGSACSYDSDCAVPNACISGTCQPPQANGAACNDGDNAQCKSGYCGSNPDVGSSIIDVCQPNPLTELPDAGSACLAGLCGGGSACNDAGICEPATLNLLPAGSACDGTKSGFQCEAGYCDSTSNVCVAWGLAGAACDPNGDPTCVGGLECIAVGDAATGVCGQSTTPIPTCN